VSISIQFLGAAGCVTGSQFLVTAGERRVLVDCGMFQGSPEETERNRLPFAFEADALDALLLTHAHLDHCGRTPALVKAGYRGPIHATRATVDLAEIVLRDSAKLQVEFTERWNRRRARDAERETAESESVAQEVDDESLPERLRNAPPEGRTETREPLYDEKDVDQSMQQMRGCDYGEEVALTDGFTAVFHDAGHILGSAIIELRVADGDESRTIVFSGDLGRDESPILRDPTPITSADAVVVEST
jgi:metallo-beta-lactamase family protein